MSKTPKNTQYFNTSYGKATLTFTDFPKDYKYKINITQNHTEKILDMRVNVTYSQKEKTTCFRTSYYDGYWLESIKHFCSMSEKDFRNSEKIKKIIKQIVRFYSLAHHKKTRPFHRQKILIPIETTPQEFNRTDNLFFEFSQKKKTLSLVLFPQNTSFFKNKISLQKKTLFSYPLKKEDITEIQKDLKIFKETYHLPDGSLIKQEKNLIKEYQKKNHTVVFDENSLYESYLKNYINSENEIIPVFENNQIENLEKFTLLTQGILQKSQKNSIMINETSETFKKSFPEPEKDITWIFSSSVKDTYSFSKDQKIFCYCSDQDFNRKVNLIFEAFSKKYPFQIYKTYKELFVTEKFDCVKIMNFNETWEIFKIETTHHKKIKILKNYKKILEDLEISDPF